MNEFKKPKYEPWPGNAFDMNDKELFQVHEDLCDDLEIRGSSEKDIVDTSVGIWAGLKFAQDFKMERDKWKSEYESLCKFTTDYENKYEQAKAQLKIAMNALLYFSNPVVYETWEVEGRKMEIPIILNGYDIAVKAIEDIGSREGTRTGDTA